MHEKNIAQKKNPRKKNCKQNSSAKKTMHIKNPYKKFCAIFIREKKKNSAKKN